MRDRDDQLDDLRAALRADAAGVAIALLGEPNRSLSTKAKLKWGAKGSLVVEITGPKKGLWFSHEATEGKDLLGLIRQQHGCNFPDAVAWARSHTGLAEPEDEDSEARNRREAHAAERRAQREAAAIHANAEAAATRAKGIAAAQQIARDAVPIAETAAEWYLKQVRGIARPAAGWPDCVRFHPRNGSLVMVATTLDGTVQAVQQVFLDSHGNKLQPDELARRALKAGKMTRGPGDGAAVRLPGACIGPLLAAGPLLLVEGPETGLAVWASTGHATWIALGSLSKLAPAAGRPIVACRDDDARHSPADTAHGKTVSIWRRAGHHVMVATPWPVRRGDKSDMADLILADGPAAVKARIEAALSRAASTKPIIRVPVEEARELGQAAIAGFFDQVDQLSIEQAEWDAKAAAATAGKGKADPAPVDAPDWGEALAAPIVERAPVTFTHGIRIDVGVGKSHEARMQIARVLTAMRARGDTRNMVLAVPMHVLADEQAASFLAIQLARDTGLRVKVWRGRSAPDPDHADYQDASKPRDAKASMCGDLERVGDAQMVGLPAQTSVCARKVKQADGKNKIIHCPLFHGCSYQHQQRQEADLWIMSHDMLFHKKPETMGKIAAVVIDESVWRKGLIGAEGRPVTLSLNTFGQDCTVYVRKTGLKDRGGMERLESLRRPLAILFDALPDGPLQREALAGFILTAGSCVEAMGLEFDRITDPLNPGQSRDQRRAAMDQAEGNKTVKRMARVWEALAAMLQHNAPAASGWIALGTEATKDGPVRVVRLKGRGEVAEGWKAPTLMLDALLPVELVRPFWPGIELVADVKALMPHQHVYQVIDRAFSLAMLEQLNEERAAADPKQAQRRRNRMRDLRASLIAKAQHYAPRRVLVVLQQAIEQELHRSGRLPSNLVTAHHNAVAGRDEWKDVGCVIVVGRTLPPPSAIEQISEAMTGVASTPMEGWYERGDAVREMVDGSTMPAEAETHTDPLAEAIRRQICDGELIQIAGRGRGVNRTAADPLDVFLMTDTPLPIALAGTLGSADLEPGPAELMMAAGGMVLENPADVGALYPGLWGAKRDTIKSALQRGKLGAFPYRSINIRECTQLQSFAYKANGQGKSAAKGGYDPDLCPDPEAFLTAALGDLAWFRVEGEGEPPEPPKPGRKARPPAPETTARDTCPVEVDGNADDLHEDMPEPPPGHPVFDDAPPDPDWERIEAGDGPWGEDSKPFWGVERGDQGVAVSNGFPTRAACCEETVRNQPIGVGPDWCEVATADRPIEGISPGHPAWTNVPSDTGWDGCWTLADEGRWAGWDALDGGEGISVTEMPSGWDGPGTGGIKVDNVTLETLPTCVAPWLHPDVLASPAPGGRTVLTCPFCGEQHRHHGYGHRLAHCDDPRGRGYVLLEALPGPAGSSGVAGARAGPW